MKIRMTYITENKRVMQQCRKDRANKKKNNKRRMERISRIWNTLTDCLTSTK